MAGISRQRHGPTRDSQESGAASPPTGGGGRLFLAALGVAAVVVFLGLSGCAIGIDAHGRSIAGIPLGLHPDADLAQVAGSGVSGLLTAATGNPAVGSAAGWIVTSVLGLLGLGGAGAATVNAAKRRAAEREAARLRGREEGWDQREAAAVAQAPLPRGDGAGGSAAADGGAAAPRVVT